MATAFPGPRSGWLWSKRSWVRGSSLASVESTSSLDQWTITRVRYPTCPSFQDGSAAIVRPLKAVGNVNIAVLDPVPAPERAPSRTKGATSGERESSAVVRCARYSKPRPASGARSRPVSLLKREVSG